MKHGVLVGSFKDEPIPLTESEYKNLGEVLAAIRAPKVNGFDTVLQNVLRRVGAYVNEPIQAQAEGVSGALIDAQINLSDEGEAVGYLAGGPKLVYFYEEGQLRTISQFVDLLGKDGWFGDWVGFVCQNAADRGIYPTPSHVLKLLVHYTDEFDAAIETTRRMLKTYPELFRSEIQKEHNPAA